jgi:hypothetical protein
MAQAALARPPKSDHASRPRRPTLVSCGTAFVSTIMLNSEKLLNSLRPSSSTSGPPHGAPSESLGCPSPERPYSKSRTALQPWPTRVVWDALRGSSQHMSSSLNHVATEAYHSNAHVRRDATAVPIGHRVATKATPPTHTREGLVLGGNTRRRPRGVFNSQRAETG